MRDIRFSCALIVLLCTPFAQGQDFSKVVVGAQKVTQGVYMLTGAGGNIGVSVGEDGIIVIDDQYAPLAPKIQEAIGKLSAKPIRFVINTHWHQDHTGGNEALGKGGAVIVAHANVRKRLSEKQVNAVFRAEFPPSPKEALPVVTFAQEVTLHFNGDELHVFHYDNAHTDGDALIQFRKARVLHMGDTFFNGMYPFIDTEAGGSIDGTIGVVNHVLERIGDEVKIIPGHGPLATRADLIKFRDMLVTLRTDVAAQLQQGKSLEQTIQAAPSKTLDAVWGQGFFKPADVVKMVYNDLKRTVK